MSKSSTTLSRMEEAILAYIFYNPESTSLEITEFMLDRGIIDLKNGRDFCDCVIQVGKLLSDLRKAGFVKFYRQGKGYVVVEEAIINL